MHIKDWNCCLPSESPINAIVLSCILECNNNQGTEHMTSLFDGSENKTTHILAEIKHKKQNPPSQECRFLKLQHFAVFWLPLISLEGKICPLG
jgi:hypothetical protein